MDDTGLVSNMYEAYILFDVIKKNQKLLNIKNRGGDRELDLPLFPQIVSSRATVVNQNMVFESPLHN